MKNLKMIYLILAVILAPTILLVSGCDSDSGSGNAEPMGTITATIGGAAYSARSISILNNNGFTVRTENDNGDNLSLTFLDISASGQYPLINRALTSGPGVAGGYNAAGETYNVDTGTVTLTEYSSSRIVGTFEGTARGLLGAPNLQVTNGAFDIIF